MPIQDLSHSIGVQDVPQNSGSENLLSDNLGFDEQMIFEEELNSENGIFGQQEVRDDPSTVRMHTSSSSSRKQSNNLNLPGLERHVRQY